MRKITDKNEIKNFLCEHRIDNLNIAGYMHNHPDECNIWVNNGDSVRGLVLYGEETKYYIINCYDDDFIKEAVRDIFDGKEVFFPGSERSLPTNLCCSESPARQPISRTPAICIIILIKVSRG